MENNIHKDLKIVGISQARMGSSRLAGKTLTDLLGKNILQWHSSRVLESKLLNDYVVATTTNSEDDAIEDYCKENNLNVYRGSSEDVFSRFLAIAREKSADIIVRMTADCPLIDPELIDKVITKYIEDQEKIDYVCLDIRRYLRGFDVEVFSRDALEKVATLIDTNDEREHVTLGIYRRPELFQTALYYDPKLVIDENPPRLCVDTPADLEAVTLLIKTARADNKSLNWQSILDIISKHPEIRKINDDIKQVIV